MAEEARKTASVGDLAGGGGGGQERGRTFASPPSVQACLELTGWEADLIGTCSRVRVYLHV